jgi:hypothetical protein
LHDIGLKYSYFEGIIRTKVDYMNVFEVVYYVYRHELSTDTKFRPQMRRKNNQISRSLLLNFKHKIDVQGVKIVYYDL